jgi:hypothetical protein
MALYNLAGQGVGCVNYSQRDHSYRDFLSADVSDMM